MGISSSSRDQREARYAVWAALEGFEMTMILLALTTQTDDTSKKDEKRAGDWQKNGRKTEFKSAYTKLVEAQRINPTRAKEILLRILQILRKERE